MKCRICQKNVVGKQIAKGTGLCKICNDKTSIRGQSIECLYIDEKVNWDNQQQKESFLKKLVSIFRK